VLALPRADRTIGRSAGCGADCQGSSATPQKERRGILIST